MKKAWERKRLGEVCEVVAGQSPEGKFYNSEGTGLPFYQGKKDFGDKFIEAPTAWTTQTTKIAKTGDILMSVRAPVGPVNFSTEEICIGRGLAAIRSGENMNRDFLFYQLLHLQPEIAGREGAVFASINKSEIESLPLAFVPLAEQQRIVGVLDEAFAGLATAQAHAAQNLQNARALFESHLQSVFTHRGNGWAEKKNKKPGREESQRPVDDAEMARLHAGYVSRTGGREATTRHIPGPLSLSVGMPEIPPRKGWRWSALSDLGRLESGHTPSRRHPEYWGGSIPWIGIQDARAHHGGRIESTAQTINELGTANSSARLLPANTVCLSRTASVGYVVVMGRPMATSQDFVNWVCSEELLPDFLKYVFLAEGRDGLLRYASGSVHQTIYFPEAKAFHICHPSPDDQRKIVEQCDALAAETQRLTRLYEQKQAALAALKKSLLHQAFTGEL